MLCKREGSIVPHIFPQVPRRGVARRYTALPASNPYPSLRLTASGAGCDAHAPQILLFVGLSLVAEYAGNPLEEMTTRQGEEIDLNPGMSM